MEVFVKDEVKKEKRQGRMSRLYGYFLRLVKSGDYEDVRGRKYRRINGGGTLVRVFGETVGQAHALKRKRYERKRFMRHAVRRAAQAGRAVAQ